VPFATRWAVFQVDLGSRPADRVADRRKRLVGVAAQGRDRRNANDDDERQHHGVFNRGRAIFIVEETDEGLGELSAHCETPSVQEGYLSIGEVLDKSPTGQKRNVLAARRPRFVVPNGDSKWTTVR